MKNLFLKKLGSVRTSLVLLDTIYYENNKVLKRLFEHKSTFLYILFNELYCAISLGREESMLRDYANELDKKVLVRVEITGELDDGYNYKPFYLIQKLQINFTFDITRKPSRFQLKNFLTYSQKAFIKQNPVLYKLGGHRFYYSHIIYKIIPQK